MEPAQTASNGPGDLVVVPARSGRAFRVGRGAVVRIVDLEGQQVADFHCLAADDPSEALSCIVTTQHNRTVRVTTGHVLYSTRRRPMFTIVEDTVGLHDLLHGACSPEQYRLHYGSGDRPNCQDLLRGALASLGARADVSDTFNIFMNVPIAADGRLSIALPRSRAGDSVALRAEMDCLVAVSACPSDLSPCNGWNPTAIGVQILPPPAAAR